MKKLTFAIVFALSFTLFSCGGGGDTKKGEEKPKIFSEASKKEATEPKKEMDPMENKGIGPVKEVELGELDQALADEGQAIYEERCTACHKVDKKYIGPPPKGIMERRSPEWVMNMILNPEEMIQKDPIARRLLAEANGAPMANQNLTEDEARAILEYFRTL